MNNTLERGKMGKIGFSEITREDIIKAFNEYDELEQNGRLLLNRDGKKYLIFWNSKEYPQKYIVDIAYKLKHNIELESKFTSGDAQLCIENNGFNLYQDIKYKEYLEKKYDNKTTINTYYSDLKKAIKIFQNIEKFKKLENLDELFGVMLEEKINFEEYDKSQKELGFDDKQLFSTYKSKLKIYLEAINDNVINNSKDNASNAIENRQNIGNNMNTKHPLNQILYGPPGTGKTYNTINKALEIIENRVFSEDELKNRNELKVKFEEYKNSGQIEFVTFHQSYGYEEFVEGIKANTDESKNITYSVEDGIFKKLCRKARQKELNIDNVSFKSDASVWKISLGGAGVNEIKTKCFEDGEIRIGWGKVKEIDDEEFSKLGTNNQSSIRNFIEDMQIGDFVISILSQTEIDGIGIIESDYSLDEDCEDYNKKRKVKWLLRNNINIKELNGNKNFVQKTVYKISRFKSEDLLKLIEEKKYINEKNYTVTENNFYKNYILIIDEINRGNISKIFGELITLIEESKRYGNSEVVEITLPHSNEKFSVPKNLYIIGTMNTADRSIAPIDTALRRRFVFEEMSPKPELLSDNCEGVDLVELLSAINTRIEYLYDSTC